MMLKNIFSLAFSLTTVFAGSFGVDGHRSQELMTTAKSILPSTDIQNVMKTEIPNVLAVLLANEEVIYIYPPKKLILIGEIYNDKGVSLTDKHIKAVGGKSLDDGKPLDITPLFKVSTRMNEGYSKTYGFIVFTDPDCPFCKSLENLLIDKNVTIDYIYTPIDSLHPHARTKAISIVMQKKGIGEAEAKQLINEGEKIAKGLGLNGTPQTIVYEKETNKPINGIIGADPKDFAPYLMEEKK